MLASPLRRLGHPPTGLNSARNPWTTTAMTRVSSDSLSFSPKSEDLVSPVWDLHDEDRLLQFLPHVSNYQKEMFQNKQMPVRPLATTLDKYLTVLEPVVGRDEFTQAEKVVKDMKKDAVMSMCQKFLEDRASKSDNWLAEWWLNAAYLGFRESVVVNVSPAFVLDLPPFKSVQSWIQFATQVVCGQHKAIQSVLRPEFVNSVKSSSLKSGSSGPCLIQYYRLYNACRVPDYNVDKYVVYPSGAPNSPRHIVVMCLNQMYSVDILDQEMRLLDPGEIYRRLFAVYMTSSMSQSSSSSSTVDPLASSVVPFGALTALHRDDWTKCYKLMSQDSDNVAVFERIHSSMFVLCLDYDSGQGATTGETSKEGTSSEKRRQRVSFLSRLSLHGGGSKRHSCNRWFDKTMQVIVGFNGMFGLVQEHSTAEAVAPVEIQDSALRHALRDHASLADVKVSDAVMSEKISPQRQSITPLVFKVNSPEIVQSVLKAKQLLDHTAESLDLNVCIFDSFGKSVIKTFKVSPDAFFQVSLQLAMFRYLKDKYGTSPDEQTLVPTYESGSLRNYRWGRTDTIRSASKEALQFARMVSKLGSQDLEVCRSLREAISSHSKYTRDVMSMKGVDRHLMGLKLAYNELLKKDPDLEMPQLFKEPFHAYFSEILLSSSQVPSERDGFVSFGPTSLDCTGVCYNIQKSSILFMVSTFHASERTNSKLFMKYVEKSLNTLKEVFEFEQSSQIGAKTEKPKSKL